MGRQLLARRHYRELADSTEPRPIKELLYLANGEATHKEKLKKLYYETVHSRGSERCPLSTAGLRISLQTGHIAVTYLG